MTRDERRATDRRYDPDAAHMVRVQTVYALAVGGVVTLAGLVILVADVLVEALDWRATVAGGALVLLGLVASMPRVFMPVLSAVLKKIPWGRVEIPHALPQIVPDEAGDVAPPPGDG